MGKGGKSGDFSWEEISAHNKSDDKWIVIEGQAYNITEWAKRHPGGSRVISHYAGQDATDAFAAFHNDLEKVKKYLKPIHVGSVNQNRETALQKDFRDLRETAKKMGLFKPNLFFYAVMIGHVLAFEALAFLTIYYYGTGWAPVLMSLLFMTVMQVQGGWLQHDFGHLSVFKKLKWDHLVHHFIIGFVKGASSHWWNHMHYQHHAKPNVINKDPDVRVEALFVVGDVMPKKVAERKEKSVPYNWQHRYFLIIGPPLLFPVYFQFMLLRHIVTRKLKVDFILVLMYFMKNMFLYVPYFGVFGFFAYYFTVRVLESMWFTWVAQSNHIPMEIDEDTEKPWLRLQTSATCNVEKSFFNDWFTGHLNFQIEHHLFPTMPRHNLYKVTPLVKSLCKKYGIKYEVKTLGGAFSDIIKSLKHSGELWEETYNMFHSSSSD